jgi:hypothetical protein
MSDVSGGEQPAIMSDVVDCRGCHTEIAGRRTLEVVSEACETCHEEGYVEMLGAWTSEMNSLSRQAAAKLASTKTLLEKRGGKSYLPEAERTRLERATKIVSTLQARMALHNVLLSEQLLQSAIDDLGQIEKQLPSSD